MMLTRKLIAMQFRRWKRFGSTKLTDHNYRTSESNQKSIFGQEVATKSGSKTASRRSANRWLGASLVAALAVTLTGIWLPANSDQAYAADPSVSEGDTYDTLSGYGQVEVALHHGHTDIFDVSASDEGLTMQLKEDVTGSGVLRAPETVYLKVLADRYTELTKQISQIGESTYVLPLTQESNSLWPGLDTFGVRDQLGNNGKITIVFDQVSGPGNLYVWTTGGLFATTPSARLDSGSFKLATGDSLSVNTPTHEHMYWAFSQKGIYTFQAHAEGTDTAGNTVKSNVATYTWVVDSDYPTPVTDQGETTTELQISTEEAKSWKTCADVREAGVGEISKADYPELYALVQPVLDPEETGVACPLTTATDEDTTTSTSETTEPSTTNTANTADTADTADEADEADTDSDDTKKNDTTNSDSDQNGTVTAPATTPSTSDNATTTASATATATAEQCIPTKVWVEGSGTTGSGSSINGLQAGGSYTVPANTHVHTNWIFNKAGTYTVTITETATLNDGTSVSADAVLHFNVGGTGTKNEGHFDLGAQIQNGSLVASMKDDTVSPAQWVDPSSVTFGLSDNAKSSAPAGIEFIANEGDTIWTIPATQIAGVPWLGANTMHESIISQTTGPVTWTLKNVEGPGQLAVFESGNFGKIVGTFWFGGIAKGTATSNTATTTSTGYYKTEGRTASGQYCQLASTGASPKVTLMLALGLGAALLGAGMVAARKVRQR